MKKTLLFLTKTFPFNSGEEFIENELPVLSQHFEKIIIIATSIRGKVNLERAIPENVVAYSISDIKNKYLRYALYSIRGLFSIWKAEVRNEIKSNRALNRVLGILYFAGHCERNKKKIKKFIREDICQDAIIYCYWFADLPYLAIDLINDFKCEASIVSRAHGYDLYEYRNAMNYIPFRRYVLDSIKHVYPCSNDGAQYLKGLYPEYAEKIDVSYLGTRNHGISRTMPENNELYKYRIVTCSSISSVKRLGLLAEAITILEKEKFYLEWICIGDGECISELKTYTNANFHKSKIDYIGSMLNRDVCEYYRENYFDLFVNVSSSEGLPVSIMEATSFGIPCLATDVGGTKEIIKDGITGRLIKSNITSRQLANELKIALNTEYDRAAVREFWQHNFFAEKNYSEFVECIERM